MTKSANEAIYVYVLTTNAAASYIPGVLAAQSIIQGKKGATATEPKVEDVGKPPTRPENDVQVEEFLKEQYRSKSTNNDTLKPSSGKA